MANHNQREGGGGGGGGGGDNIDPSLRDPSLREMVGASQRLRSECTLVSHSDIALHTTNH